MGNMETAELVNLYQTGFYCCMALSIVSAITTLYIFIKKDIKTLFIKKTGIARRQTARQMQMKNERTDQLNDAGVDLEFEKTDETRPTAELHRETHSTGKTREYMGPTIIQGLFKSKTKTGEISGNQKRGEPTKSTAETVGATGATGFTVSERIVVTHTKEMIDIEV